jgi:hypothetical protein
MPNEEKSNSDTAQQILAQRKEIMPRVEAVEKAVGCRVVAYYLEEGAALADEQMLHLYEHLRRVGRQDKLALWLSSRGGATEVSWKVVALLREFTKNLLVLVPYRCHSAATQVALGADQIVMTEMSELGPVDPSRRHPLLPTEEVALPDGKVRKSPITISVQDLRHVLKFLEREIGKDKLTPEAAATIYTALFEKVHPLAIGALEQSWALSQQICERVLASHMKDEKKIAAIVERLSDFYKSHLYQISRNEAREIGLPVRDASDAEAAAMWDLYVMYTKIRVEGGGEINGRSANLARLGHIDSVGGSSIGLALTAKEDPTHTSANWASTWVANPVVAQGAATAVAQPSGAKVLPSTSAE